VVLRVYFSRAINLNVNLFAFLILITTVYFFIYADDSTFVLVAYMGALLLLASLVTLLEIRTGKFFDDWENVSDLISNYSRFRQKLIETQASQAEEAQSG
jgi:hypothetical protein